MQIHRRFERRLKLAFAARGGDNSRFPSLRVQAFLDRMGQRRMRADLEPDIDAKICQRVHGRREPHWFTNAASPVLSVTGFA
jgi:hypothetical protein